MDWFKVYSKGILYGTTAMMSDLEQATWFKMLSLANETKFRDGSLRFGENMPMTRAYLATLFHRSIEQLDSCIERYKNDVNIDNSTPRLVEWEDGTLFITNFEKYQAPPDYAKPKQSREDVPLAPEDKQASQQAAAARLGYLQPEAAKRGIVAKEFEQAIKKGNKQLGKVAQSSKVVATTEGGEQ